MWYIIHVVFDFVELNIYFQLRWGRRARGVYLDRSAEHWSDQIKQEQMNGFVLTKPAYSNYVHMRKPR